ncbi:MAG: 2,4-dienoyl-CoA reductase, partial [Acidimicrobiaceae bacterium]|nr:2,4-dienoyl-CoA reductase [Acidimicrobiaceae bacterium]
MTLATPIRIGSRDAPSRVMFGPHETNLGDGRRLSDRHVAYYARRARGGVGVIIVETASVEPSDWPYERAPLAADCRPGWAAIARACAPEGTLVLAGLGHTGLEGSSAYSQQVLWGPSRIADVVTREPPAEMEQQQIDTVVSGFAAGARGALEAGLAGVEVDAGPRSLLRQFLSGLTNLRGDDYGSDRARLAREVLHAVRTAMGPDAVLGLRLSCDELAPWAGITPEQASDLVEEFLPFVDVLTVVRGGPFSAGAYRPDGHTPPGFNQELCRLIRQTATGRALVVLQGSVVSVAEAQAALDGEVADLVEMTRAGIADPDLVRHVRDETPERIRPCIL